MSLDPEERKKLLDNASRVLQDSGCVVMPTETVYGVFTRADAKGAALLEQLTGIPQISSLPPHTLHLGDSEPILPMLSLDSPVARRLVNRMVPGPVRMLVRQPEAVIDSICKLVGLSRGLIDDGESIALRLPDHPITRAVIRASDHPTLARGVGASQWGKRKHGHNLELTNVYDCDDSPGAIIDDGPTFYSNGSTTIDIWPDGRFKVSSDGAIDEERVMRELTTRVLFVCTGNTCRSPMAAGLAREWARSREPDGLTIEIDSAGIAAGDGQPAADQAIETLRERGGDLGSHRSKILTLEMIDQADLILTMTPSHAQAVMQIAPGAEHKVFPIDPLHAISDPIGQPIEVYREVADQLGILIERRLQEIIDE